METMSHNDIDIFSVLILFLKKIFLSPDFPIEIQVGQMNERLVCSKFCINFKLYESFRLNDWRENFITQLQVNRSINSLEKL